MLCELHTIKTCNRVACYLLEGMGCIRFEVGLVAADGRLVEVEVGSDQVFELLKD